MDSGLDRVQSRNNNGGEIGREEAVRTDGNSSDGSEAGTRVDSDSETATDQIYGVWL